MCGFFFTTRNDIDKLVLMEHLSLRGNDDFNFIADRGSVLVHARLMLSGNENDGLQPVKIKDTSKYVLYNGEIYSFGKYGKHDVTESDTSYLVKLLSLHNFNDVISELDGMFSIALIDVDSGEVLVARDRFGQKPLFYSFYNGHLILSSSSFLCSKYSNQYLNISKDSLLQYFAFGFVGSNSIYSGVHEVPTSTIGRYNRNEFDFQPYRTNVDVYEINNAIDRSIDMTISTDYKIAIALSGGIDSTAIASFYKNRDIRPLAAITISSKSKDYDESKTAYETAKKCGFEFIKVQPDDKSIIEAECAVFKLLEEPISDSGLVPNYILAKAAKDIGAKVLITGDGGDEIFAGYNRHALYSTINGRSSTGFLIRLFLNLLPRSALQLLLKRTHYGSGSLAQRVDVLYNSLHVKTVIEYFVSALSGLPKGELLTSIIDTVFRCDPKHTDFNSLLELDRSIYLKGNNLYRGDRISLGLGVEARAPFLNSIVADNAHTVTYDGKSALKSYIRCNGLDYKPPQKNGFNISPPPSNDSTDVLNLLDFLNDSFGFNASEFSNSPYFRRRCYFLSKWFSSRNFLPNLC